MSLSLQLSVSGSSEKDLGLFCIGSGNVSFEATIARKGHLPGKITCLFGERSPISYLSIGESIKLKVLINNSTTLKVQPRATLYQTQIFMTGERHRTLELVLGDPVCGNEVDTCEVVEELIEIPVPIRAQLTMKSAIITVKYL